MAVERPLSVPLFLKADIPLGGSKLDGCVGPLKVTLGGVRDVTGELGDPGADGGPGGSKGETVSPG
jgi:hypothetical protein